MVGRFMVKRPNAERRGRIDRGSQSLFRDGSYAVTRHAWARMSARSISPSALRAVLELGRRVHTRGAVVRVIGRKEVERAGGVRGALGGLEGLHVVCSPDETMILTVYKNRSLRGLRPKARRPPRYRCRKRTDRGGKWHPVPAMVIPRL